MSRSDNAGIRTLPSAVFRCAPGTLLFRSRVVSGDVAPFHCLTFTTDYGLADAFVAVCHAVVSQIAPDLQITVDGFGNVQLPLPGADAPRAGLIPGTTVTLAWDGGEITVPFVRTFGEVAPGESLCYRDSGDWVAIAVAGGDAARRFGLRPGTRMTLTVS